MRDITFSYIFRVLGEENRPTYKVVVAINKEYVVESYIPPPLSTTKSICV